jgi:hypothetical protein
MPTLAADKKDLQYSVFVEIDFYEVLECSCALCTNKSRSGHRPSQTRLMTGDILLAMASLSQGTRKSLLKVIAGFSHAK